MMKENAHAVKLFYSYSHEDRELRDKLAKHLGRSHISAWSDREILPGKDWEHEIDTNLESADIILLLISVDFTSSDYCYGKEMKRALEREKEGSAVIIPIILRHVEWPIPELGHLQALPDGGKPVRSWTDLDEVLLMVARGIRRVINTMLKERDLNEAEAAIRDGKYEIARIAYQRILKVFPDDPSLHEKLGQTLLQLGRFSEALQALERAIELDPKNTRYQISKARAQVQQEQWREALYTYQQAIEYGGTSDFQVYKEMGEVLFTLGNFKGALQKYEEAINLFYAAPQDLSFSAFQLYMDKGNVLSKLKNFDEALKVYELALELEPKNAQVYAKKAATLVALGRYQNAKDTYDEAIELEPENPQFLREKGELLLRSLEQFKNAAEVYEKALQYEKENAYIYKEYGDALFALERFDEANAAFGDAINLAPTFSLAYRAKSKALRKIAEQIATRLTKQADEADNRATELENDHRR